jgi:hypothetical protein
VVLPLVQSRTSSTTGPPSGELAFAARLMPATNAFETNGPATNAQAQDSGDPKSRAQAASQIPTKQVNGSSPVVNDAAAPPDKTRTTSLIEQLGRPDVLAAPPPSAPQSQSTQSQYTAPLKMEAPAPSTSGSPANRMDPMIELPSTAAASNRDITVRVPDATERGMDVRFVERAGEVHVSVRTSDADMAQTLRGGLNDFVGRFEHGGVRAEVWRPGQDASSPRNGSDSQGSEQKGSGSGKSQQERENRRQAEKPRWVEALELSAGKQSGQTSE